MEYQNANYKQQGSTETQVPSIINDLDNLWGSMREVFARLQKVGDNLHGPTPRDATIEKAAPPEVRSARRLLDLCQRAISDIHDELNRIERNI